MTRFQNRFVLIILTLLCVILTSCSMTEDAGIAKTAIEHFHVQLGKDEFHEIYVESADDFKQVATEEKFTELLSAIKRKLGPLKSSSATAWRVNYTTMGTMVNLQYKTEFEEGPADETFVFRIKSKHADLMSYNINSATLVTK